MTHTSATRLAAGPHIESGGLACLWWNLWLENFDGGQRERTLEDSLSELIVINSPTVVALQEVVPREDRSMPVRLLESLGYECYLAQVTPRISNLLAIKTSVPHEYTIHQCGHFGTRENPLQIVTIGTQTHPEVAFGNVHWLMMRPASELARWRHARVVTDVVDRLCRSGTQVIVGGDMNTPSFHPILRFLARRYRVFPDRGATWSYRGRSVLLRAALDHVFAAGDPQYDLHTLAAGPSDHKPLLLRSRPAEPVVEP